MIVNNYSFLKGESLPLPDVRTTIKPKKDILKQKRKLM